MKYKNLEIEVEGHQYEVFWTSQYAKHVLDNFYDKEHRINHVEIGQLLANYAHHEWDSKYKCVFISRFRGTIYNTFAFLQRGTSTRAGRCVVITSYRVGGKRGDYSYAMAA